jgi:hypothetical protein
MIPLYALWLPILLSAVAVFIASSVIHMLLTSWHKNDFKKIPDEDRFRQTVGPLALPTGDYIVPYAGTMDEMKTSGFAQKRVQGPVLLMTVMQPGPINMGPYLVKWFIFTVVISFLAAYVASATLPPATEYLRVFQIVGVTAFIGYTAAMWPLSIWYHRDWGATIRSTVDGLVYALLTAGIFGWLWPH